MKLSKCTFLFFVIKFCFITNFYAQPNVYVDPPTQSTVSTPIITVNFRISNVTNLHSYEVNFHFNEAVIKYKSITKGSFLSNSGSYSTFLTTTNNLTVAEAILGPYSVSGSGLLFSAEFDVLTAGQSPITIESSTLWDLTGTISGTFTSGNVNVLLSVNVKVLLQGPYNGTDMNTSLKSGALLPSNQPYSSSPWNYMGSESVSPLPNNMVDWILVELRTSTSAASVVGQKAGLLLNNGLITGMDGTSPLGFLLASGEYYIVIIHRNHLKIMSLRAFQLDFISDLYNFTTEMAKAWGASPMIGLSDNVYGMISGDANSDGEINATDRSLTWNNRNTNGYSVNDVSLDGRVNASDRSLNWNNRNKRSQVP